MKTLIMTTIIILFSIPLVLGNIVFSEVMYNPSTQQGSDTDIEWIELYNNGSQTINLTEYKIDGNNFQDTTIEPGEFIVVARELIDGGDADEESFEAYYGNNDGIWNKTDGNYKAVDGDFSLTNEDTIILSHNDYEEILYYNDTYGGDGNGYTITKKDLNIANTPENWKQGTTQGGTPGRKEPILDEKNIKIRLTIVKSTPEIIKIDLGLDEDPRPGIQIIPIAGQQKQITFNITLSKYDQSEVKAYLNDQEIIVNNHQGNIIMNYYDAPGIYELRIELPEHNVTKTTSFEYLSLTSSTIDTNELDFGELEAGQTSQTKNITIKNTGNTAINLKLDLKNFTTITEDNIEYYYQGWKKISENNLIPLGLEGSNETKISMRIQTPQNITEGNYEGILGLITL